MGALFDPGKAARKAKKKAEREAAEKKKKQEKKKEEKDAFVDAGRKAQRSSLISGRAGSTQVGVGGVLGG